MDREVNTILEKENLSLFVYTESKICKIQKRHFEVHHIIRDVVHSIRLSQSGRSTLGCMSAFRETP
jgi:hypothetical protein